MAVSYDPLSMVDVWYNQLRELRTEAVDYEALVRRDGGVRPPLRPLCVLLGVQGIDEVVDDDILYRAVQRVAQMQVEEQLVASQNEPAVDVTTLRPAAIMAAAATTPVLQQTVGVTRPQPTSPPPREHVRPPALNVMMDLVQQSDARGKDAFVKFLTLADEAHREMARAGVVVVHPRFMATDARPEQKVTTNSALKEVFAHYCVTETFLQKIEPDDFSAEMVLKKVMAFCRDFQLYPKLVTKDEVRLILSVIDVRNARLGLKKLRALSFDAFFDFLVRVALFAYHKPAVKKKILTLNGGLLPSKMEMVDYLCKYLHLDDLKWVRDRLRSTKNEVHICTFGCDSPKPVRSDADAAHDPGERPLTPRHVTHVEPLSPTNLPFLIEKAQQIKALEGIKTKPKPKPLPAHIDKIFVDGAKAREEAAREKELEAAGEHAPKASTSTGAKTAPTTSSEGRKSPAAARRGPGAAAASPLGSPGGGMDESVWLMDADQVAASNAVTDEQRALISSDLDSALCKSLGRYAHATSHRPPATLWQTSEGGCFLDMGRLTKGTEMEIQLVVTNASEDTIYIDTTCKGLESPDTRVVTKPASLVPGLSRVVSVLFTVQPGDRTAVGTIQVFVASIRTGLGLVYDVPVHYRVGPPRPETDDYRCTLNNLEDLKGRYLGPRKNTALDFHKTNKDIHEREERYNLSTFPKVDTTRSPGTVSTLGSFF